MRRGIPYIVVFVAFAAHAGEHNYRGGVLKRIEIKDVTSTLPIPTGSGQNIALPLRLGINYQFEIQSDMMVYVGNCRSKTRETTAQNGWGMIRFSSELSGTTFSWSGPTKANSVSP